MAAHVTRQDVETLVAEIEAYLDTVDAFRAEGREPSWSSGGEPAAAAADRVRRRTQKRRGSSKSREGG